MNIFDTQKKNSNKKPQILLYDIYDIGVILSWPSGVIYKNQVGGNTCWQKELEGIFFPVGNSIFSHKNSQSLENDLYKYFVGPKYSGSGATYGIDNKDADFIDSVLQKYRLDHWLSVDRAKLKESCEAWVCINILNDNKSEICTYLTNTPLPGVLTWDNSD